MEEKQKLALARFGIDPDCLVHKDGRYWMTAEQIGKALGFRNPRQSVMNLYNRHRKELAPHVAVIKLMTPSSRDGRGGGLQEVTIFNTRGQFTLSFLANTQVAEKFRTFAVNMLEALERKEFIHVSQVEQWRDELIQLRIYGLLEKSNAMDIRKYREMLRYRGMGLTQKETAKLLDISATTVKKYEGIPRRYELRLISGGAL